MPSNRELIEAAEALGEKLGVPVATRYLNNAKLTDLVEQLTEQVRAREAGDDAFVEVENDERPTMPPMEDAPPEPVPSPPPEPEPPPAQLELSDERSEGRSLPELPAEHKRPTVEEWTKQGYKPENYLRAMLDWERDIRRKMAEGKSYAAILGRPEAPPVRRGANVHTVVGDAVSPTGGRSQQRSVYRHPFNVAQGVMLVTKRGKLPAFAQVRVTDFAGGEAELEQLVSSGHVVKRP
jgi:hypothetical protein